MFIYPCQKENIWNFLAFLVLQCVLLLHEIVKVQGGLTFAVRSCFLWCFNFALCLITGASHTSPATRKRGGDFNSAIIRIGTIDPNEVI